MKQPKAAGSTIDPENYQESLDAESSAKWATLQGQQQYETPQALAAEIAATLANLCDIDFSGLTVFDPQCGLNGKFLAGLASQWAPRRYGCEMDNRARKNGTLNDDISLITGNCVTFFEVVEEYIPNLFFDVGVANPPFGKKFKTKYGTVDSTIYTWERMLERCNQGAFIANSVTIEKLKLHCHPYVLKYETREKVWKNSEAIIGIVYWKRPEEDALPVPAYWRTDGYWTEAKELVEDDDKHPYNVWLGEHGMLKCYLSMRFGKKQKLSRNELLTLASRLHNVHPLSLTADRETRKLLASLVTSGVYLVEPKAAKAIKDALAECAKIATPIMPVTDFQTVAYADEEDSLVCKTSTYQAGDIKGTAPGGDFTTGYRYEIRTESYRWTGSFTRNKVHYSEKDNETYTAVHNCTLSGTDRYIEVKDDTGQWHRFMDRPREKHSNEHDESMLWKIFEKPQVLNVADLNPELVAENLGRMKDFEFFSAFKYYPGQSDYVARLACKDSGLCAGAVGTGKSLACLTLIQLKNPQRSLIIAPQGTLRSSVMKQEDEEQEEVTASQWINEIHKFAPGLPIYQLFSMDDYWNIKKANGGVLPFGVYITYFAAMFSNDSQENAPKSWDDDRLFEECKALMRLKTKGMKNPLPMEPGEDRFWCDSVGKEQDGIRCIMSPTMATQIGHEFDGVFVDESHIGKTMEAQVTQQLIRLQPKYRYCFSATPIADTCLDLFSQMGWLCVPEWYKGGRRNSAWPYARDERDKFQATFMAEERDHTQEEMNTANDPKWRGKCVRRSPVISSPARLLKITSSTLAYISKEHCNPDYKPGKIIDVRVPMGVQQAALYAHYLNRGNIGGNNALVRAQKQSQFLRYICADPIGFSHGDKKTPKVSVDMNPKVWAVLNLVRDLISKGQQVLIISARIGFNNTIAKYLMQAGIAPSRIDSTIPAAEHAYQHSLFKEKKTKTHLMGIRCAMGYSYDEVQNEIISSIEWAPGPLTQAAGRIDRVNSKHPANIWCMLNSSSIEEVMFDTTATKDDAATICLQGKRLPRAFKPVDASEILAEAIKHFDFTKAKDEKKIMEQWPDLRKELSQYA